MSESDSPASDAVSAADKASAPAVISEEHAIDPAAKSGQAESADAEADLPEMTRAAVRVGADAASAATLLSYNGMSFQVGQSANGEPTAALVGFSTAPQGELDIPATITAAGTAYVVTNICPMGGGVQRIFR